VVRSTGTLSAARHIIVQGIALLRQQPARLTRDRMISCTISPRAPPVARWIIVSNNFRGSGNGRFVAAIALLLPIFPESRKV
jgi:hypothetical protein